MRRPAVPRLLILLTAVVLVAGACGDDDGDTAAPPASATTAAAAGVATTATGAPSATAANIPSTVVPQTTAPASASASTPPTVGPTVPTVLTMGQTLLTLEDKSRPTNAVEGVVAASSTRKLPTLVSYPAATAGTDVPLVGGPYPLVVLAHGVTATVHEWDEVYPALVAAGYVVAAPDFPETTGGPDFRALADVVYQPEDVTFVIDQMLAANADKASRFYGSIDPERIGIGGHSGGAITVLLDAYNTKFGDPRIGAVYESAGAMFPVEGGTYDFDGKPPLLLVHGDADTTVSYQGSVDTYAAARAPKWFITVAGAGHNTYLKKGDPGLEPHNAAVVAFYDRYLKEDDTAEARLQQAVVPGLTSLQFQA